MVKTYKDLVVWQKSILLVKKVYLLTASFPKHEVFGLSSQMQRAVISIPSNIAEGFSRESKKEFQHFLNIAFGSARELETQMIIAKEIGYSTEDRIRDIADILQEVLRMLYSLRKSNSSFF